MCNFRSSFNYVKQLQQHSAFFVRVFFNESYIYSTYMNRMKHPVAPCVTQLFIDTISTRSGASNKLKPPCHINNTSRHSYFHRIPYLWNAMPTFDLNKSFCTLKTKLKQYLWDHRFKSNFDINNNCIFHHSCPCSKCHLTRPPSSNFDCF